jgi:RimJ/RimL family protein N-acetyltransferase
MSFRKITGVIASVNNAMLKLQLYLGMQEEGYLKRHTKINQEYKDLHILSLFKEDFGFFKNRILILLKSFN